MNEQSDADTAIKNAALALLARREHSKQELLTKLGQQFPDNERLEQQIENLVEDDLQSDKRFVESFIRVKKEHGKGPAFIKHELRKRGISEYLIAAYVYDRDEEWMRLAKKVYTRKFGTASVVDNRDKARRIRFMVSRGFPFESIASLLES